MAYGQGLDEVLERITDAFSAFDLDWRITYLNGAAERMARRPRASLIGRRVWDEYPDLVGTELERQYRRAMAEQVPVDFEYYYAPLDLWVEVRAYPSRSGLSVYACDITAHKRAAEALARSEARYRMIAENAHEGMWLVDAEYRTVWCNRRMAEMVGLTAETLLGRPIAEFVPESSMPELRRRIADRRAGRADTYDILMQRADRTPFWALACIAPVLDPQGRFQGALGMLADITERKRFEAELAAQKEWLRVTLASIGDAVIATDQGGRVTFMNGVAETLTGWPAHEAAGQPLETVFRIVNEMTRETVESPVSKVLRLGTIVGLANHTILIARDGSERPIDDSGAPIHDLQGRTIGVVLVFRDNTERARTEKALREADRRKDEFLALLGHELRNPLAPITSALEMIRLRDKDAAAVGQAREVIARQVEHMTRLVDDLLDVSRVTRGNITLRREPGPLGPALARAAEIVRPQLERRRQQLRQRGPAGETWVAVDGTRIAQVLGNLLHNASKFSPDGAEIEVACRRDGSDACIEVRDAGRGIAPHMLERIFEPFVQAETSLDRAQGGLGLGLTLVKTLVELHGGRVSAHSDGPGCGSTFTVRLPLCEARAAAPPPPAQAPAVPSLRVLVVDDNRDAAQMMGALLRIVGHEPAVAHDAMETLERVRERRPDVVLLDIGLPRMDGYELARVLRADARFAGMRLVALSGYGLEEDRRRALEAGFDLHLVKPASLETLQAALQRLFVPPQRRSQ